MKRMIYFILVIFLPHIGLSQNRYQEIIADSVEVSTYTYATKEGEKLNLDVYQAYEDWEENRPIILYVHGGGFSGGTRDGAGIQQFCKRLAQLGYVSVSMSYRLTRKGKPEGFGCDCPAMDKLATFDAAREDIQDASFFLVENRDMFRIDPYRMILAGSSAGAEAILNAGYQPPMCYDLPKGPVSYAGLISMAGAMTDTAYIYDESAIPSLLFHGTCDNLVPYGIAPHHFCDENSKGYLMLYGSYPIAQKLRELDVPYWLHTTCGAGHEINWEPMVEYFDDIKEFCYEYIILGKREFRETVIPGDQTECTYGQFDFCNN